MSAAVVVVGNFNIDNVVTADGRLNRRKIGGNAVFAALGARIWEPRVGIVSVIPANYPSSWLEELAAVGIDLGGVRRAQPPVTREEWLFYQSDGSRRDHIYAPADEKPFAWPASPEARLKPAEVARLQAWVESFAATTDVSFRQFRALNPLQAQDVADLASPLIGAHIAPNPYPMQLALAQALRSRGALVSLDPTLDPVGPPREADLAELLSQVDIFLPSQRELQALYPDLTHEKALSRLAEFGPGVVGVKLGAQGSLIWARRQNACRHIPAYPAQVVDLTGAGDAFCGGFLQGMLATGDAWLAACWGSVSASLVIESASLAASLRLNRSQADERLNAPCWRLP